MAINNKSQVLFTFLIFVFICVILFPVSEAAQFRIVGGEDVKANEVRYQASLRVYGQHTCGGTIITSKHILTAAHCLEGLGFEAPYDDITVVTGAVRLLDTRNEHIIADITVHEKFINSQQESWLNDIAVITLEDEIDFDETQAPARLPVSPVSNGLTASVVGWGRQDAVNPYLAKVLKKATLKVLTAKECQPKVQFPIREGQICAFGGKNTGICKGDSGGPLVVDNTIIGISSWSIACATGVPDVFTSVYNYLDFINEIVAKSL